jgi:hypothetical protein
VTIDDRVSKIAELLLYVAEETETDETAGSVKYNKILYFGEVTHMRRFGTPITGAEFQKNALGPTLRDMKPIVQMLIEDGAAREVERDYFGRAQKRLIALRHPDLSAFSGDEIAAVDTIIRQVWGKNAKQTSELSHDDPGWRAVEMAETIPMGMAFVVSEPEVTDRVRQRARSLASEALSER